MFAVRILLITAEKTLNVSCAIYKEESLQISDTFPEENNLSIALFQPEEEFYHTPPQQCLTMD